MEELIDVLTKLENAGYRLSESKSDFFKNGNRVDRPQNRPKRYQTAAR